MELDEARVLRLLRAGDMDVLGLLPMASNATLLSTVDDGEIQTYAVYKPQDGETPLWDFPDGTLCLREQAAWVVDRALGWGIVPPTVLRTGPLGYGAVQLFVEPDPEIDLGALLDSHPDDLRRLVVFDLVINNADRKASHCLLDANGHLWGVDHGIAFHAEPKVRTVLWVFADEPIPPRLTADLEGFLSDPTAREALADLLSPAEVEALADRTAALTRTERFPAPGRGRQVPWPPW